MFCMTQREIFIYSAADVTQRLVTSTPHKLVKVNISNDLCKLNESDILPGVNKPTAAEKTDCNKVVVYENAANIEQILDPNDIDEVFVVRNTHESKNGVPEYISPLGTKYWYVNCLIIKDL